MVTVRQLKAARALLGWSQSDLARESGVSLPTIGRLEMNDGELGGDDDTRAKLIRAIDRARVPDAAGVIFIEENGEGPGVRLRKTKRKR
jgi:transcriptional regulator with XRE-family HTH domain